MARLGLKKRTKQLDDAREVALPDLGKNVWTTKGELDMQSSEKEELSSNLKGAKHRALIAKLVNTIQQKAAAFFESSVLEMAPSNVARDYMDGEGKLFADWLQKSPFMFVQDGLTARIYYHNREIASLPANVPALYRDEVLAEIRRSSRVLGSEQGGGS